jgi:hypothetical protein
MALKAPIPEKDAVAIHEPQAMEIAALSRRQTSAFRCAELLSDVIVLP